jgi:hypothetical protein
MSRWSALIDALRALRLIGKSEERRIDSSLADVARAAKQRIESGARPSGASQPPSQPPNQPPRKPPDDSGDRDSDGDFRLPGRDASYDTETWQDVEARARLVQSSNVYSFFFEIESLKSGTLFVTFLDWAPGMKPDERSGPGATYSYSDFPTVKYREFEKAAASSAGKAVWDYCRVRHTQSEHQHTVKLIQVSGDYVPRKATRSGFSDRTLVAPGLSPLVRKQTFRRSESRANHPAGQFFKRSTLASTASVIRRGEPSRGTPKNGRPNGNN